MTTTEKTIEKMSKYTDLQIECQRMWNKKVKVIPVIIGATGIVDRNIKTYIGKIPGSHNISITEYINYQVRHLNVVILP